LFENLLTLKLFEINQVKDQLNLVIYKEILSRLYLPLANAFKLSFKEMDFYIRDKFDTISKLHPDYFSVEGKFQLIGEDKDVFYYQRVVHQIDEMFSTDDLFVKLNCLITTRHTVIACIKQFWDDLGILHTRDLATNSDQLICILSYVLTKSKSDVIYSNFKLMEYFMEDRNTGEAAFCLVTFHAAIEFLIDFDHKNHTEISNN